MDSVRKELNLLNQSAVNSLDEGLEETLTLHRLGMFEFLGISLKTTNCLESLNSQLEQYTRRVRYWKTPVNDNTGWLRNYWKLYLIWRKIKGYNHLPLLQWGMEMDDEKQIR